MNVPRTHDAPMPDAGQGELRPRLAPGGFVDEFGERTLSFDSGTETIIETLRLRQEFAESTTFESALRARVVRVGKLHHAGLATVQAVRRTDDGGLSLVSAYASGRRLSELGASDNGFALAVDVIRKVTPALAALQDAGAGMGHGALSLNRLVMTRDKRLIVVEHVLASALESLHWARPRFNELGLVVADEVPVRLDERNDLRQLAWIVLGLVIGRDLEASDYPGHARGLLEDARSRQSPLATTRLGDWLERALQLSPVSFATARDAERAFEEVEADDALQTAESDGALLAFYSEPEKPAPIEPVLRPPATVTPISLAEPPKPTLRPVERIDRPKLQAVTPPAATAAQTTSVIKRKPRFAMNAAAWIAIGLGAIAVVEALVIVGGSLRAPIVLPPSPVGDLANAPPPSPAPVPVPATKAATPSASPTPAATQAAKNNTSTFLPAAPPAVRVGGFTVTSAIELQVFENGKPIGLSTGPIAITEGRHTVEFVNASLGYRVTQLVNVIGGQMTPVRIAIPNGTVFINAVPWADITVDGKPSGQTPLGNLSLPIGSHEIVFRHPELGERRQTVLVRADAPTRVSQSFR